jgi:hypothetical protein
MERHPERKWILYFRLAGATGYLNIHVVDAIGAVYDNTLHVQVCAPGNLVHFC